MWTNIDVAVKEVIAPEDVADTADEHEGLSREALHRAQVRCSRISGCDGMSQNLSGTLRL